MRPDTGLDASKGIFLGIILSIVLWFLLTVGTVTVWSWLTG